MRAGGASVATVAKRVGVCERTVRNAFAAYKTNGRLDRKKGSGRKRKLTRGDERLIVNTLAKQRVGSVRRASADVAALGIRAPKSSVHRIARNHGMRSKLPYYAPKLTPKQIADRVAFCTDALTHSDEWFGRLFFSDEKMWGVDGSRRAVWVPAGVVPPAHPKGSFPLPFWCAATISLSIC